MVELKTAQNIQLSKSSQHRSKTIANPQNSKTRTHRAEKLGKAFSQQSLVSD